VGKLYIVEKELRHYKVSIEYVLTDFPQTPAGQLMKNIYASFAQFERDEIKLRMMRGKRNKVKDGNILVSAGGPYGYRVHQADRLVMLEPDKTEAVIVRQIFTWYAREFLPIREIVRRLDEMSAPEPESSGRKREGGWPRSTVFKILRNKVYAGEWDYTYDGFNEGKKRIYEATEHYSVKVTPLIDVELWQATQAILNESRDRMSRATKYEYLFGRRLTCGECGRFMACEPQHTGGRLYLYYACPGPEHNRLNHCKGMRVRVDQVDNIAWNWLADILKDPDKLQAEIDIFQTQAARQNAPVLGQIQITDDLLAENRTKLQRLVDLYMSGEYTLELLQERKHRLEQTIQSLEGQRAHLAGALEGLTLTPEQVDELQAFAAEIRGRLDTATYQEKVQLFHILNVTGLLELTEAGKVLHVQCIIRPDDDTFMIDSTLTRPNGPGILILPRFLG
jgi:site-specific DNA recombinase